MDSTTRTLNRRPGNLRATDESLVDYQRRREIEAEERIERRRRELDELTLDRNVAGVRIRAWEKMHALRMPSDPGHPILEQIAFATQLTLADVQEEQRARCNAAPSAP